MPGHVKRGGAGEPDPDPAPYLFISYEEKQKGCLAHTLDVWKKSVVMYWNCGSRVYSTWWQFDRVQCNVYWINNTRISVVSTSLFGTNNISFWTITNIRYLSTNGKRITKCCHMWPKFGIYCFSDPDLYIKAAKDFSWIFSLVCFLVTDIITFVCTNK